MCGLLGRFEGRDEPVARNRLFERLGQRCEQLLLGLDHGAGFYGPPRMDGRRGVLVTNRE